MLPSAAQEIFNYAVALYQDGRATEAIAAMQRAAELAPNHAPTHNNLGFMLRECGRLEEALSELQKAILIRPDYPEALGNLGNVLRELGRIDEALLAYQSALRLRPDAAAFHSNVAHALADKLDDSAAERAYKNAIALDPNNADAHFGLAHLLLRRGDFAQGWRENEWRWQLSYAQPHGARQPLWQGEPLAGKSIFLHAEQGFGDTIQFFRYAIEIAQAGGRITLRCQKELRRLLAVSLQKFPDCKVPGENESIGEADFQCPLLSLGLATNTTFENIPHDIPYLQTDAARTEYFRAKLAASPSQLNVGLVWAGRPTHPNDRNRSIPPVLLSPLTKIPGVRFVSLQKMPRPVSTAELPLLDFTAELSDFADTAALVMNLDLVITVDTAVAHLAGALGKPIWVLLPYSPDWRWLLDRSDSPWYPTMQLFRQKHHGDWSIPLAAVAAALQKRAE